MSTARGIVLTGTRAAGKTEIARALRASGVVSLVPAVTTRPPRDDDEDGAYDYRTPGELDAEVAAGGLLLTSSYGEHRYAIRRAAISAILAAGGVPLLTITPESAARLLRDQPGQWAGVFVDANDDELDRRIATRGTAVTTYDLAQRAADREHCGPPMATIVNDGSLTDAVSAVLTAVRR